MHASKLYLSKSAYEHNINFIKKLVGKRTIISSVVKGNAYGHGIKEFVPLAESCGVNHFSVFSQDEAYKVKKYSKNNSTIMIMGFLFYDDIDWVIKNDVEFYLFNIDRLMLALESAKRLNKKICVHIELETGMNRTGFSQEELPELFSLLKEHQAYISIKGLCTHFAGAESISNYYRIKNQIKRFKKLVALFDSEKFDYGLIHTSSSAGAVTLPKTRFDLVRIGIMQYGFWPTAETRMFYLANKNKKIDPLMPILTWKSELMSIKNIRAGEYIGYGDSYLAQEDTRVGTVPVGYAQGYGRILSNNSRVIVNGDFTEVIGIINMNLFQVDLTHIPDAAIGDSVTLIGRENDKELRFASFKDMKSSLNYEILTRLPEDIPREIVD